MQQARSKLQPEFIERQRDNLLALQRALREVVRRSDGEQQAINAAANDHTGDLEEDAQRLAANEVSGNLSASAQARLSQIERALQKIDAGNYGFSELSGDPIPLERLAVYPDATLTLEEQAYQDRERSRQTVR